VRSIREILLGAVRGEVGERYSHKEKREIKQSDAERSEPGMETKCNESHRRRVSGGGWLVNKGKKRPSDEILQARG